MITTTNRPAHHTPSEDRISSPKTRSFYYPNGYGIKGQRGDIGSRGQKGSPVTKRKCWVSRIALELKDQWVIEV